MSDFVNYNGRSIKLLPGCKHMMHALYPGGLEWLRAHFAPTLSGAVVRSGSVRARVSEIGKYVQMAFESSALAFTLVISPSDESLTFNVTRVNGGTMWASVVVEEDTPPAAAVRNFFARHSLQLPEDSSMPGQFFPRAPVHLICHISPMPSEAGMLSRLVTDLFREVCDLSDESELCYEQEEMVNAA